jgi:hypothetical protein
MKKKTETGQAAKKTAGGTENQKNAPGPADAQTTATPATKAETIIRLLREPKGATLRAIMAATGWQPHSVRGFISAQLTKKRKLRIKSFKRADERVYKISR